MKKVYVCSEYRGLYRDYQNALEVCEEVIEAGGLPLSPHAYFPPFIKDEEKYRAISMELLKMCDVLYHDKSYDPTDDMVADLEYCRIRGIEIISDTAKLWYYCLPENYYENKYKNKE